MTNQDSPQALTYPILLCGGGGTRLWPLSRQSFPKQFVKLVGEQSLFQATAKRLSDAGLQAPIVVTSESYRFIVTEHLVEINLTAAATLIEPDPRNTAPAILAAALWLSKRDPEAIMLVTPSDHIMPDTDGFSEAIAAALPAARSGKIVTFGITPTRPETGYGYLELHPCNVQSAGEPLPLTRFIEKPDVPTAQAMLASGNFLWNAGIFLFSVKTILQAFATHAPQLLAPATAAVDAATQDLHFLRLAPAPWAALPSISIDYAIMEKTSDIAIMPYLGGWSDLGSWDAVWQETNPDADGNVISPNSLALDCRGSMLRSEDDGIELVGIGLDGIIAVAMKDAVLVARKSDTQRVKEAVDKLKSIPVKQATALARDYRPWGWYESLATGGCFQVKRIVVKPGAALSLQSHQHRSEHWIVVEGTAKVTVNEDVRLLAENESAYIPVGAIHRLENPGKVLMVLIEVQTGPYLGEDDIIRYADVYARG